MPKIGIGGTGNIDHIQMDEQASTPSTPGAGKSAVYLKSDGLYAIDGRCPAVFPSEAHLSYTDCKRVSEIHEITHCHFQKTGACVMGDKDLYSSE